VEMTAAGKAVWFEVDLAVSDRLSWGRGRPPSRRGSAAGPPFIANVRTRCWNGGCGRSTQHVVAPRSRRHPRGGSV
jgi:hypothetical protein